MLKKYLPILAIVAGVVYAANRIPASKIEPSIANQQHIQSIVNYQ